MPTLLLMISLMPGVQQATDDSKAIVEIVTRTQRAGLMKGDLGTYMSLWTSDAQMIAGRRGQAGKYDVRLNRQQIENSRRIRFSRLRTLQLVVKYDQPQVRVSDKLAELQVISTVRSPQYLERVKETFKLRRTKQGWRAYENRWHLVEARVAGRVTRFDDSYWKERDAEVERRRVESNPFDLATALQRAFRFKEAHEVIAARTTTIEDWRLRAELAILLGNTVDAIWSYRRVIAMGQSDRVPPIVQEEMKSVPQAVAALQKRGARVRRDKQGRIVEVNLQETRADDRDLVHLEKLYFLKEVSLHRTKVSGHGLRHLKRLEQLTRLYLTDTGIDDASAQHLQSLGRLRILGLSGTRIGDKGLSRLDRLRFLKSLFLLDTQVTDAGVARLQKKLPKCDIVH